jgi:N-methylhydantoinase B
MCQELEERAEAYMRNVIRGLPDGTYSSSKESEGGPNAPFSISMSITVSGDEMLVDLAGTSPEVDEGINSTYSYTYAYSMYGFKCLLAAELPFNDGLFRPLKLVAPEGSVVNCRFPAASSGRSTVGHHLPTLIFNALADAVPEAIIGDCGNPPPTLSLRGKLPDSGAMFATGMGAYGGYGARAHKDGISALSFPTNVQAVSIEMLEIYNPLLFLERGLIPDSGGPGTFRGGLGQRLSYQVMTDEADGYARAQWVTKGPRGVRGGKRGGRTSVKVNGKTVQRLGRPIPLGRGDVVTVESAGSGGYGPPSKRDRAAIEADVRLGYVSPEQAEKAYKLKVGRTG